MNGSHWLAAVVFAASAFAQTNLEQGFLHPPLAARPDVYWLWLNGYYHPESARADLQAMKDTGFGGVLLFDMGAFGDKAVGPPAGPAFLSPEWMANLKESVGLAKSLGMTVDLSVISSWDLGGHWIEPRHASMGLYTVETTVEGGKTVDTILPFPLAPPAAPRGADGKPAFWTDIAVLGIRNARRQPGHEFVLRLDADAPSTLREVVLDNGEPNAPPDLAQTMTPTREFSVAVSLDGTREQDFREVVRGTLTAAAGSQRFPLPTNVTARYVRLRLLSGHDAARPRWTIGEFGVLDDRGVNVAAARVADTRRRGALFVSSPTPLGYDGAWNVDNLSNGSAKGPRGVFAPAGLPGFVMTGVEEIEDLTAKVDRDGRLHWNAPTGQWTILRYVCMNTGERLKLPSPSSDGWATDHLNPEATRAHMDYVVARLREAFGDLRTSGLKNLYLASYEVRGPVWSPGFAQEFQRRRGYEMTRYLPAIFGARIGTEDHTARFLFDYRKTLGEVLVDSYYVAAREVANKAGLTIKSEAGGPGPPVHNVPVDALSADNAVDEVQGEFWPFWPNSDGLWVVKETASASHVYNKGRVHMESFTSFEEWREGPQDIKPSADRVFCEGGNHMVWHTWAHNSPAAGKPGWAYSAGTHINRNVTWWPKAKPFLDYLSRSSFLLQSGTFVADVLYYYGDGGYRFVGPKNRDRAPGRGYDYDVANSDVVLNRLQVSGGRLVLPAGPSYAVLVLPDEPAMTPEVLAKIEQLVKSGATVIGPKPLRAPGLQAYPASDMRVAEIAARLWGNLDGVARRQRSYGKGTMIWGIPVAQVLAGKGIGPDAVMPESMDFIHRRVGNDDVYFVRNQHAEPVEASVRFRTAGREPELWDAVRGSMRPAPEYRLSPQGVEVPLALAANGSVFVVFRRPASADRKAAPLTESAVATLGGEWEVEFDQGPAAPPSLKLPELVSWTQNADARVRYFSGSARYRKTFEWKGIAVSRGVRVELDLGNLWTIADVRLNGKPLGVVWTAPYRVDCTTALREGTNELTVEVTNTWYNRLVGDARLPVSERTTRTNITTSGGKPWAQLEPIPSGLFGPVRLMATPEPH